MVKGKPAKGLGKAVIKSRFKRQNHQHDGESFLHTTEMNDGYDWGRLNLQSVTEESNLKDFLSTAELAGTEFTAEKLNVKFVDPSGSGGLLSREDEMKTQEAQEEHKAWLRIPRRPEWDSTTSPEDLDKKERESFLEWRRKLAQLQEVENIMLTPFEKNLDFWRQLWRVIERSDIIVQIVDARNPLLFRCEDLETYVKELSKEKINILLINKADHLSQSQREVWYDYFTGFCSDKIKVVFWSAVNEAKRQEAVEKEAKSYTDSVESDTKVWNVESIPMEDDDEECGISKQETEAVQTFSDQKPVHSSELSPNELECNPTDILNGPQLIDLFKTIFKTNTYQTGVTTVGMVGYPNVGKSSTINAILQMKKVPVSATPGRTKHFQTLYVDKELMLCDCPGLVFPSFVSTKAELILNGVLPVDQMRDHVPPISLLCQHIPRSLLEQLYGINIPKPGEGEDSDRAPRASELLKTYAYMRGFFSSKGVPDCARASRIILKDYITGRLLYCNPPPSISPTNFQSASPLLDSVISQPIKADRTVPGTSEMDQEFFSEIRHKIHSKGAHGVSDFARSEGLKQISRSGEASLSSSQISVSDKPWKKHNNRNKKEKTRRIYAHLDKH